MFFCQHCLITTILTSPPLEVQEEIVTKLQSRLSTISNSTNNEGKVVLLHSLGNTGSPQAMKVLLEYVDDSDLDVQKVAISGLRMFTTLQVVQDALTDLLKEDVSEEVGQQWLEPILHIHSLELCHSFLSFKCTICGTIPFYTLTSSSTQHMHTHCHTHTSLSQLLFSIPSQIVESIAQTLISGLRDHAQHTDAEGDPTHLNLALVRAALKSENVNLHNLVFQYLKEVGTEDADKLMSVLMEEAVSDPIYDYDNYNSSEVAILSSLYVWCCSRVCS